MRRRPIWWLVAGCACAGGQAPAPVVVPYDRAAGLATFDAAWRIVRDSHFDTTFNGLDWNAERDAWRPRAEAARDPVALRGAITGMLERLGQSHFAVFPREAADSPAPDGDSLGTEVGTLGLDVRLIGDELVITTVEAGGPAAAAGLRPGWVVVAIRGQLMARLLARVKEDAPRRAPAFALWSAAEARMAGPVGSTCPLVVRDDAGRDRVFELVRRAQPAQPVKFGSLPTFFARFASREFRTPAGRSVGVIWFNFWMVPLIRQVDSAMDAYRGLDGVVVDLRGNRGGLAAMIVGVAGHFLDTRDTLGTFQMRRSSLRIVANPRRVSGAGALVSPFAGPVAVLVDEGSASASEVFAGGMRALGRVRVFGGASAGAVLPAVWDRLPNGDILYHAIAEFVTAADERLEGRGVLPDEPVALTRHDLLAGRDPVLDAALAWIDRQ